MSDKPRWKYDDAIRVADEIKALMDPACKCVVIAGSLRRKKATVGDVELVFVPRTEVRAIDMFASAPVSLADEAIEAMLANGVIEKRASKTGSFAWGAKNKLAKHVESGIPIDFFATTAEAFFNYLVCRTGPAESNTRIATAAQRMGWKWNPYGPGFTNSNGETVVVTCERDVFRFVGLPYHEPEGRQ